MKGLAAFLLSALLAVAVACTSGSLGSDEEQVRDIVEREFAAVNSMSWLDLYAIADPAFRDGCTAEAFLAEVTAGNRRLALVGIDLEKVLEGTTFVGVRNVVVEGPTARADLITTFAEEEEVETQRLVKRDGTWYLVLADFVCRGG